MKLLGTKHRSASRKALGCLLLVCSSMARADDSAAVTPYRPSVSTPAALSAPGWLEVEAGFLSSRAVDTSRRESLPYTFKLALTPDWGIRFGGDAFVRQRAADGSSLRGGGDSAIVLKRRLAMSDSSAFGIELGVQLPTARSGIGRGHSNVMVNGIYSSDLSANWHTDINLAVTRFGSVDRSTGAWQHAWAAALSRNLNETWGVVGELSGTRQRGYASTWQALAAASCSLSPALSIDLGVSKGLNNATGGWSVFAGLTFMAVRLF